MCGRYYEQPRSFNYGTYYLDNREFTILIQKIFYKIQNIPTGKVAFQIDDINDVLIVIKCMIKNCLKRANKPKLTSLTTAKTKFSHRRQNPFFVSEKRVKQTLQISRKTDDTSITRGEGISIKFWTLPSGFGRFCLILNAFVRFGMFISDAFV